jgi:hypothetical protein
MIRTELSTFSRLALTAFSTLALASSASAQVSVYGTNSNFDVVNDTGHEVHGFEIEYHGSTGITSYYNWNRYGNPTVKPMPNGAGMIIRWMSPYNTTTGTFVTGTPMAIKPTVMTGHQCVIGTFGYESSGCEHFGLGIAGNATRVVYRWLVADPLNPGMLKSSESQVGIPAPIWSVQPPAAPGEAAVIIADIDPPIPPKPAKLFGEAQWMKTYKTENARHVGLDELIPGNAVVPEDPAEVETDWDLVQAELGSNSKRKQKRGGLGAGKKAVVRRFELYKFTGQINPVTGEAICADGLCNAPAEGEVGDFIGAQNAAVNLNAPDAYPVTVTVSGDGQVSDANRLIRCPGTCSTTVNSGGSIALTVKTGKSTFTGWSGACQGTNPTCLFTVNSASPVTATFKSNFKLVLKTNGIGTVSSNPSGTLFPQGSKVTVTAAASPTWKGWTGAGCSGTSLSCTVTVNADTTVTANFR